jgi:hypothetical protein
MHKGKIVEFLIMVRMNIQSYPDEPESILSHKHILSFRFRKKENLKAV